MSIDKQTTGFRFGKYSLQVLDTIGTVGHNGRVYRLVLVQTHEGQKYCALRLYNSNNHFIKQFLFEPVLLPHFSVLFDQAMGKIDVLQRMDRR